MAFLLVNSLDPDARATESLRLQAGKVNRGDGHTALIRIRGAAGTTAAELDAQLMPTSLRSGEVSLDHFYQAAPGGRYLATYSAGTGIEVLSRSGARVFQRDGQCTAFRFSLDARELAMSTKRGIEAVDLASGKTSVVTGQLHPSWIASTRSGWVARENNRLYLEDGSHNFRLAKTVKDKSVVTASDAYLFVFEKELGHRYKVSAAGTLQDSQPISLTKAVVRAEASPDGRRVLLATKDELLLREGNSSPVLIANIRSVSNLAFSADSQSFLWVGLASPTAHGAVNWRGRELAFGSGVESARFSEGGTGSPIVVQGEDIERWDIDKAERETVGGICLDDGDNLIGDVVGNVRVSAIAKKSLHLKMNSIPHNHPTSDRVPSKKPLTDIPTVPTIR